MRDKHTQVNVAPSLRVKWRKFESNFTDADLMKIAKRKRLNIVAVISHCKAASGRDELINRLQNLIDVDVYGSCGNLE